MRYSSSRAVFESMNGATRLRREFFEPDPDEESTAKADYAACAPYDTDNVRAP